MKMLYLLLGSNLGDRETNIARAIDAIAANGVDIRRCSPLYETEPVGMPPTRWFLNCVVEGETGLMPRQLLSTLLRIERSQGRRRGAICGPRTIDIDILLFGASVVQAPGLEIPHPRMADRRFVLVPLRELAPELQHPVFKKTISELFAETRDLSQVRLWHPPLRAAAAE